MRSHHSVQAVKRPTAARKPGVYVVAPLAEFREGVVSCTEFDALQACPPQWPRDPRRNGPHPVVAVKPGIPVPYLPRGGGTEALTTQRIEHWGKSTPGPEHATQAEVHEETVRLKAEQDQRAWERARSATHPRP